VHAGIGKASFSEEQLAANGFNSIMAQIVLVNRLSSFWRLDSTWSKENLFPLLRWTESEEGAARAWRSLLGFGRIDSPLDRDLLPYFMETLNHLGDLGDMRALFSNCLAKLALFEEEQPTTSSWLIQFINSSQSSDRAQFATIIWRFLREQNALVGSESWLKWLRDYLLFRIQGSPEIETDEWSEMMSWVLEIGEHISEFLDIMEKHPAHGHGRSNILYTIRKSHQLKNQPGSVARLLIYLLGSRIPIGSHGDDAGRIVRCLKTLGVPRETLLEIAEMLAEVGYIEARNLERFINSPDEE